MQDKEQTNAKAGEGFLVNARGDPKKRRFSPSQRHALEMRTKSASKKRLRLKIQVSIVEFVLLVPS
jgi:hypothetical protein